MGTPRSPSPPRVPIPALGLAWGQRGLGGGAHGGPGKGTGGGMGPISDGGVPKSLLPPPKGHFFWGGDTPNPCCPPSWKPGSRSPPWCPPSLGPPRTLGSPPNNPGGGWGSPKSFGAPPWIFGFPGWGLPKSLHPPHPKHWGALVGAPRNSWDLPPSPNHLGPPPHLGSPPGSPLNAWVPRVTVGGPQIPKMPPPPVPTHLCQPGGALIHHHPNWGGPTKTEKLGRPYNNI